MKGQTEIKHDILEKYLQPWLFKITEVNSEVEYIDGFAGRGRYNDESQGSPLIAMDVANEHMETLAPKLSRFGCTFVENDPNNFANLESEVRKKERKCGPQIKPDCKNEVFESFARQLIDQSEESIPPSFIFIDPFGFSGVPFETVKFLINLRSSGIELFITFMSGKMAQFMENPSHEVAIDDIMGTDEWRNELSPKLPKDERAEKFVRMYERQLREEADTQYVWPFEMSEAVKRQNAYYLVHATNHFDGFKIMKDIMYGAGADQEFAYLGPDHYPYIDEQQTLDDVGLTGDTGEHIQRLSNLLHDRFSGRTLFFSEVMKDTYEETTLIEKHYREACKQLRDSDLAEIINRPNKPNGTESGLNKDDEIRFIPSTRLSDFSS